MIAQAETKACIHERVFTAITRQIRGPDGLAATIALTDDDQHIAGLDPATQEADCWRCTLPLAFGSLKHRQHRLPTTTAS